MSGGIGLHLLFGASAATPTVNRDVKSKAITSPAPKVANNISAINAGAASTIAALAVPFPNTSVGIHIGINSYGLIQSYLKTNPTASFANKVDYIWSSSPHTSVNLPKTHLDK